MEISQEFNNNKITQNMSEKYKKYKALFDAEPIKIINEKSLNISIHTSVNNKFYRIFDKMERFKDGKYKVFLTFHEDPMKKVLLDEIIRSYKEKITKPMCLLKIRTNLTNNIYNNVRALYNDIKIMFDNCRKFNNINDEDGIIYHYYSNKLQNISIDAINKLIVTTNSNKELVVANLLSSLPNSNINLINKDESKNEKTPSRKRLKLKHSDIAGTIPSSMSLKIPLIERPRSEPPEQISVMFSGNVSMPSSSSSKKRNRLSMSEISKGEENDINFVKRILMIANGLKISNCKIYDDLKRRNLNRPVEQIIEEMKNIPTLSIINKYLCEELDKIIKEEYIQDISVDSISKIRDKRGMIISSLNDKIKTYKLISDRKNLVDESEKLSKKNSSDIKKENRIMKKEIRDNKKLEQEHDDLSNKINLMKKYSKEDIDIMKKYLSDNKEQKSRLNELILERDKLKSILSKYNIDDLKQEVSNLSDQTKLYEKVIEERKLKVKKMNELKDHVDRHNRMKQHFEVHIKTLQKEVDEINEKGKSTRDKITFLIGQDKFNKDYNNVLKRNIISTGNYDPSVKNFTISQNCKTCNKNNDSEGWSGWMIGVPCGHIVICKTCSNLERYKYTCQKEGCYCNDPNYIGTGQSKVPYVNMMINL